MTAADLGRPTPCAEWTLGDLLAHMTVQHNGFAAAAAGRGADLDVWKTSAPATDPVTEYAMAAELVLAAFAEPGVLERGFSLPEIIPGMEFPAAQAISFHFIDNVVHGWDVARALGAPFALDADLVQAALPVAEAVPDGERRLRPGAAFRPRLNPPAGERRRRRRRRRHGPDPGAAWPFAGVVGARDLGPAWSAPAI